MIDIFFSQWWGILITVIISVAVWVLLSALLYRVFFKRFYDIVLSIIALILLSPALIILSILIRIKLGSPVIFKQTRPGKDGKPFTLHKFRTMTNKKDAEGNLLPDEQRLTKLGKFLRAASLDELPEFFDVLRGKMSLVGPRPLLMEYLPLYNEEQAKRHKVKPGITGLAQVSGRNALDWDSKFKLDVKYAQNVNLFTDIAILFKTVFKVFKREGISMKGHATMEVFKGNNPKAENQTTKV